MFDVAGDIDSFTKYCIIFVEIGGHMTTAQMERTVSEWGVPTPIASMPTEYIERDFAGWGGHLRYTYYRFGTNPKMLTLVQQPFYKSTYANGKKWIAERDKFFAQFYRDLPVITPRKMLYGHISDIVGHPDIDR